MNKKRVLVGMSGGVDSSVSAALLLEQGYEVIGGFMKNWSDCDWREDRRDAMRVAAKLGIEFYTFDFEKQYREQVVEYMYREYEAGRTPNPDVMCNKYMKFDLFLKEADRLGCDFVATGHYCRTKELKNKGTEEHFILAGKDSNKDQSYFLWAVNPAVVPRILFPVGELLKPEVREKAEELGLATAKKKDSQGICFIGEVDLMEFLKERIKPDPGLIVDMEGRELGQHEGLAYYTIGQRHGLDVGGGTPYYVIEKRPETKELVVSSNYHPQLYGKELEVIDLNWFGEKLKNQGTEELKNIKARIRYRQPLQDCVISFENGPRPPAPGAHVSFKEPQRAVTPGQSIVFYNGDVMLGGGIIK
jgi:tRNA-uridine 2-sulfurtransferase